MAECKAWIVRETGEFEAALVFAETRGKGKMYGIAHRCV